MANFSADEYFLDIEYLKKFYSFMEQSFNEIVASDYNSVLLKKWNLDIDTLVSGWIGYTDTQKF